MMNFLSNPPADPAPTGAKPRSYGADLLRIVCMLMILTSHFFVHGRVLGSLTPWDVNFHIGWFAEACCYVMVDCFVLITGYYQSASKFRLKKFLLLWGQTAAISGGIWLALCVLGKTEFSWSALLTAFTPITGTRYWFATAYLFLYALSPLLNFALERADRKQHLFACAVLWGLFVVWRNLVYWQDFANLHGGYSYTSFIVLYVTAAYLRKYPPKKHRWLAWYFLLSAVTALSRILMTVLYYRFGFDASYLKMLMQYNSVTVVPASVCLFLFFLDLEPRGRLPRALIRFFAPLTFGIYLIHEQTELKVLLWDFLHPSVYAKSPALFLILPATVLSLYLLCALTEAVRRGLSRLLRIPELFGTAADRLGALCSRLVLRFLPPGE